MISPFQFFFIDKVLEGYKHSTKQELNAILVFNLLNLEQCFSVIDFIKQKSPVNRANSILFA